MPLAAEEIEEEIDIVRTLAVSHNPDQPAPPKPFCRTRGGPRKKPTLSAEDAAVLDRIEKGPYHDQLARADILRALELASMRGGLLYADLAAGTSTMITVEPAILRFVIAKARRLHRRDQAD
jgi:hypothetical protein